MAGNHKTVRSATIQSPVIRTWQVYLHEKRTKDGNKNPIPEEKQKYEFVGLVPKLNKDAAACKNYMLFANLAMGLIPQVPEWNGQYPSTNWPIKDGDQKAAKYPFMANHWVINFSGNYPPRVAILQNGSPTEIPARRIGTADLYKPGDYCVVSTYAFTYDNQSRGIKFDMEGVCFVGAGEPIGMMSRSVDQMFEGLAPMSAPGPIPAMPGPGVQMGPPVQQHYAAPVANPPMSGTAAMPTNGLGFMPSPPVAPGVQQYASMPPQGPGAVPGYAPAPQYAPQPGQAPLPPLPGR